MFTGWELNRAKCSSVDLGEQEMDGWWMHDALPVDRKTHSLECDGKLFGWVHWNCRLAILNNYTPPAIFYNSNTRASASLALFVWFVLEL